MNQLNQQELDQHVTILGWLHIIGSSLFALIGLFVFVLLFGIGFAVGEPEATRILAVVGIAVGALLIVLAIPGIVAGYGLLRRKMWGRILALVVGFLNLVNFPLGTAVGIYTFFVLLQDGAHEYFTGVRPAHEQSLSSASNEQ